MRCVRSCRALREKVYYFNARKGIIMATPLLSQEDREEVLRLFTEMKSKYGTLDAAIAAGKPVGEIKTALDKIDAGLAAIQTKHTETIAAAQARLDAIEESSARSRPSCRRRSRSASSSPKMPASSRS